MVDEGRQKILAEIGGEPVSGFYDRPGAARLDLVAVEGDAEAFPAPLISSRDGADPQGWPAPVMALERLARSLGWRTVRAYARGRFPHGTTGAPLAERETFSVRFARDAWQGYAIYAGGPSSGWKSIFVTGATLPPFGQMGREDLTSWLEDPARPAAWYDAIRVRRVDQAARQKQAAATRPKKSREGMS